MEQCSLNQTSRVFASSASAHSQLPAHLDPDAPVREGRQLADTDREQEERLMRSLLQLVRAGLVDEAQKLCRQMQHSWRAATMCGWVLAHDENLEAVPRHGSLVFIVWLQAELHLSDK